MAKVGRKSKFNDAIKETILRLAKVKPDYTDEELGVMIGVSRQTIANWKGKHDNFLEWVKQSKSIADDLVEASLFQRAVGYSHPETKVFVHEGCPITEQITKHHPPDTQAAMFWLRNRQPKRWKEKTEGDVNVNNNINPSNQSDEQLDARIEKLLAKQKSNGSEESEQG